MITQSSAKRKSRLDSCGAGLVVVVITLYKKKEKVSHGQADGTFSLMNQMLYF